MQKRLKLERLYELLEYDDRTGIFLWRLDRAAHVHAGDIAGRVAVDGYRQIKIDQAYYRAHRLAWLYVNGTWPSSDLDHKDGNRDNNSITNLRLATKTQNQANRKRSISNKSGYKGVVFRSENARRLKPWRAIIGHCGRSITIGHFGTAKEAHAAYDKKSRQLYGRYARAA